MSEPTILIPVTRSQQMALIDILTYHIRRTDEVQVFVNCSSHPVTETTTGELLRIVQEANAELIVGTAGACILKP
jgi:hypothetical protein